MEVEHFIYGSFKGVGQRLIQTSNVSQILTKKSLGRLKELRGNGIFCTPLPEGIIAISFLRDNYKDEYERQTTWNHTILITASKYCELFPPILFEPYFITNLDVPPRSLEPLKVTTK